MSDNLDPLLLEAISKSLFDDSKDNTDDSDGEDGEIVAEEGEIESGDDRKSKHKKSRHKSKHKSKCKVKSKTHKSKKSSKSSESAVKSDASVDRKDTESESKVMKLLLSEQLTSYAGIEFKDQQNDGSSEQKKKSSKHKSSKSGDESKRRHKKSSKRSSDYELQNDSYYPIKSSAEQEDYFYGSYYEGTESRPRHRSRDYSRPLSPLYETDWKYRSRSRSPIEYNKRSRRRSLSPNEDSRHRRDDRRSVTPFYKDSYKYKNKQNSRRSLSPSDRNRRDRRSMSRQSMEPIDKERLYEIARNNLIKMIEKGDLPKGTDVNKLNLRHLRELTTQKSVQQWTEFCRAISTLESVVGSDSDIDSDSDCESVATTADGNIFTIRHPFKLKERKDIQFSVRNFHQLPSRSAKELSIELREQFPVSSGNKHRLKELEWKEVPESMPPPPPPPPLKAKKPEPKASVSSTPQPVPPPDYSDDLQKAFTFIPPTTTPLNTTTDTTVSASPAVQSAADSTTNESEAKVDSVFSQSLMPIDIGSVMAQRLNAMRKLSDDPHNVVALKQMYQANQMMTEWAESKMVPGQFIGSTGANILTPEQLNGSYNAWTRKDQLKTAAPITGGVGMHLLLKMGWSPGQGLGKNNEGTLNPIALDIKMDKKGLVAEEEQVRNLPTQLMSGANKNSKDARIAANGGRNPVSILYEMCSKRKMGGPVYQQVSEEGPPHKKTFTFKVVMGGVEYQPSVSSANKKLAKALAASVCLQSLGLLPKDKT
ncbi:unnamed protein product [Medioppia subpectinata]|uniref:Protein SON n=1 Tax=Medioppia subpectinata TaxID=1979941 RepID=A0A7R9KAZ0_9ACAR|nr:unnamed protein product [Medioppia subpectinata]CAG2100119.1 unnamed protein product [Medioppia subpectinata]